MKSQLEYHTNQFPHAMFEMKFSDLVADGVLEEVTGNDRNKKYRAREIFAILEQPPQTY